MIPKNDCFQDLNARTTISQEMSGTPSVDSAPPPLLPPWPKMELNVQG